jgi:hypothetical protein
MDGLGALYLFMAMLRREGVKSPGNYKPTTPLFGGGGSAQPRNDAFLLSAARTP